MKRYITLALLVFVLLFAFTATSLAQEMMGSSMMSRETASDQSQNHASAEEIEGKKIWQKVQNKKLSLKNLSDDDFAALGEYFMGKMMGDLHEAMNDMMIQMMGVDGEREAHIAMGKRLSGFDDKAPFPREMMGGGMMSMMMNGMASGSGMHGRYGNNMMGGWMPFSGANHMSSWLGFGVGLVFMLLLLALVVLGIVALVRWLGRSGSVGTGGNLALNILKERYARGEIDKKEFEEKKKELI
jgi:putative membrane protein